MSYASITPNAVDLRIWLDQIALICLSKEFQKLKNELESFYGEVNVPQADVTAFADALYTFLTEYEEAALTSSS
ncbi:MAG: hypothetical protein AB1500_05115 [Bacillota bacterium]